MVAATDLTRIFHERFCCNLGFAAFSRKALFVNREAQDRKNVAVSSHARYELRFTRNAPPHPSLPHIIMGEGWVRDQRTVMNNSG